MDEARMSTRPIAVNSSISSRQGVVRVLSSCGVLWVFSPTTVEKKMFSNLRASASLLGGTTTYRVVVRRRRSERVKSQALVARASIGLRNCASGSCSEPMIDAKVSSAWLTRLERLARVSGPTKGSAIKLRRKAFNSPPSPAHNRNSRSKLGNLDDVLGSGHPSRGTPAWCKVRISASQRSYMYEAKPKNALRACWVQNESLLGSSG